MWNKCKTGHTDPEKSWHNCISLDWMLMLIALMEWNQNGMNNTSPAPINATMLQADGKWIELKQRKKFQMQVQCSNPSNILTGSGYGRIVATLPKACKINNNCCFPTAKLFDQQCNRAKALEAWLWLKVNYWLIYMCFHVTICIYQQRDCDTTKCKHLIAHLCGQYKTRCHMLKQWGEI